MKAICSSVIVDCGYAQVAACSGRTVDQRRPPRSSGTAAGPAGRRSTAAAGGTASRSRSGGPPEPQFSRTRVGCRSRTPSSQSSRARLCCSSPSPRLAASCVGAGPRRDVVVELEVADAELVDQPVDRRVQVSAGGGAAQVEQVAVALADAGAAALQEGAVRQRGRRAGWSPRRPRARARARASCRGRGCGRSRSRARAGSAPARAPSRRPRTTSPAVSSYHPASMTKYSAPDLGGRVDQRQQLGPRSGRPRACPCSR